MFENLLFQEHFVKTISHEIANGTLPQSVLFYGESFSGKLTAAIELARVLNCDETGEWQCQCKSCHLSRNMQHPYLLIAGTRYFNQEIKQAGDFLIKNKTVPSQFIFIRNVRKLIKRFSQELWDKDDNKLKKITTSLNKINEVLYLIEPSSKLPAEKKLESTVKKIITECEKLSSELPKGNIPINQIRNITNWVRRSVTGSKKIVILERAELMQDSSRNSLLKILEEPPEDTHFILISEKKSTVLPTILSRVRAYGFKERSAKEQSLILDKIFKYNESSSIKDFFNSYSSISNTEIEESVDTFINGLLHKDTPFTDSIDIKLDSETFKRFLETLTIKLRNSLLEETISINFIEKINELIRDIVIKHNHFNQNPMLLLETLYYQGQRLSNA